MKLEDLAPAKGKFYLSSREKEYTLREVTFRDRAWMKQTFEKEPDEVLRTGDVETFMRIAYHQLLNEDKKDFMPIDKIEFDEDGNEKTIKVGGVSSFLDAIISEDEGVGIIKAIMKTIGISEPIINEFIDEDIKKKELKISTMENYGTTSQVNTDIPLTNS